jgi:putative phosphoribosyl transferase
MKRIAKIFNTMGLSTLPIVLLTNEESEIDLRTQKLRHKIPGLVLNKFNIGLLTERLVKITEWLTNNES